MLFDADHDLVLLSPRDNFTVPCMRRCNSRIKDKLTKQAHHKVLFAAVFPQLTTLRTF